ncbi:ABC transporter substrate-binding protein [Komagataeibacter sp. FNDCR2]|uniref:ABC transporter substrate-binding protein n=1 Tax=Komagataeibacter sp. FNDCR2 TaxID=2878682 RepID=UPI001E4DB159|nr:ABC transporter substrate-binding protein [Komagataeibacter sp. FNDCR2]MCE2574771.1 ABC transporter substrate-binding protein [Komagataeibacter sp. FNDCR2]
MVEENRGGKRLLPRRRVVMPLLAAAGCAMVGAQWLQSRQQARIVRRDDALLDGEPHDLTLSWPYAGTSTLYNVALRQDFFSQYRLDVHLREGVLTGRDAIADLQAGRCMAAVAPLLSWLQAFQADVVLPARLVMGLQAGTFRLLVRRRLRIAKIEDLVGHRIAVLNADMADRLFFSVILRCKGLNPDTAPNWVILPPDQIDDALLAGSVDAVALHDPLAWQLLGNPALDLVELVNSVNGLYARRTNLALGISADVLQQTPSAAVALVLALSSAARWLPAHMPEAATLLDGRVAGMRQDAILQMMRHEVLGISPVGNDLKIQIARYVDELKLLGLFPDSLDSAGYARHISADILHHGPGARP